MSMFRYALRSLRANLTRLLSTATAVVIGIGFLAAGLMLTDAMEAGLTGDIEQQYAGVDVAVVARSISSDFDLGERVQAEALEVIRGTDGVAAAVGEVVADVRVLRPDGNVADLRSQGRNWIDDDQLNPLTLVEGRAPEADDEVVLDAGLAEEVEAGPGQSVTLQTPVGERIATVTGVSRFGDRDALDPGGTVSFPEAAAVAVLNAGTPGYTDVLVRVDGEVPGVLASLRESLPPTVDVQTGPRFVETASSTASTFIDFLRPALQGFAYLSLFVCAFVIFNTFSVVVTQRTRELALIRAVGGTPAQIRRSLLAEGLGIGVTASLLGLVAGALFAVGLQAVLELFDITLPGSGVKVTTWTVVICLAVGTLVTVLSVMIPAFRAGRTKPIEAMRSSAVDTSGTSKVRAAFGGFFLLLSLTLLLLNQFVKTTWMLLAPGSLALFVGLIIGGPLLARLFARTASWPMSWLGLTGRLAADNSVRNPKRTATTANALVIGLFLVTLVTVAGEAIKTAAVTELNKLSGSDYLVVSERGISEELRDSVAAVDGVTESAAVRIGLTSDAGGSPVTVSTTDFDALGRTAGATLKDGSLQTVEHGDDVAVADLSELFGQGGGAPPELTAQVGEKVGIEDLDGRLRTLEVGATLDAELDSLILGFLVGEQTFVELVGEQPVSYIFVRVEPGKAEVAGERIERVLRDYTNVEVVPGNFLGQIVAQVFDFMIGAINGLLGMSVVIALVGIVNTMTLSIYERRRELGLVRALGMTRQQVGRMVRLEAVLIGLLGTLIGMAAGMLLGWVVISSLDDSIDLSLNWFRLGLIFLVGLSVGVIAAIGPTRRATKVDMLDAMRSE